MLLISIDAVICTSTVNVLIGGTTRENTEHTCRYDDGWTCFIISDLRECIKHMNTNGRMHVTRFTPLLGTTYIIFWGSYLVCSNHSVWDFIRKNVMA